MRYILALLLALAGISVAHAQTAVVIQCYNGASAINPWIPCSGSTGQPMALVDGYGAGNKVIVSPNGDLTVSNDPYSEISDSFSAASVDTTTNWNTNDSTGTSTQTGGVLTIASSTTNAAWGGLTSKQSFTPSGISLQIGAFAVQFPTSTIANTARVFGIYTVPGTPTNTAPVTDGYVWRLDGSGNLFAEVWAAGSSVSSTNVTTACKPADGSYQLYRIFYRQNYAQFVCGTGAASQVFAATYFGTAALPSNQVLPINFLAVAGTSPGASATMLVTATTLVAYSYPALKSATLTPTLNDPALVSTQSPNSIDPCQNLNVAKSSVPINVTSSGTAQIIALSGTTAIYVCGFIATIPNTATTSTSLKFIAGTGTNCATPTATLTGAMGSNDAAAVSANPTVVQYNGPGTVFSGPSASELCTVVTGNGTLDIEGVLTYVQR